jgi:hypothetical protein
MYDLENNSMEVFKNQIRKHSVLHTTNNIIDYEIVKK